ncbi:response regulator [Pedobacter sp. SD-b]|uniref:histidine kinase n=1 Tax=Pedobacter segetis TaxID=2793069 RepID=A0ABS1BJR5_9SPHI|nr:hybrid sensor histidine kinase/response regulator transcription factor [Pedobacter segetis]MBK0383063.1 response regulator [Pedobacter segetis]
MNKRNLLTMLFVCYGIMGFSQIQNGTRYIDQNGLTNNEITSIHQDKYGFLWVGTRGGLNKFDGNGFSVIRNLSSSNNNFSDQSIEVIAEGAANKLWIGTKSGGLNSYDLLRETITKYPALKELKGSSINALTENKQGKLFIGTGKGFFILSKNRFIKTQLKSTISAIKADGEGGAWIGGNTGLYHYVIESNKIIPIHLKQPNLDIASISLDEEKQILYLGTWRSGMLTYNIKTKQSQQFVNVSGNEKSISGNDVYVLFLDRAKNIWAGTWGNGLNKFNAKTGNFTRYHLNPENNYNDDYKIILSLEQDKTGILWIGTDGGGICKIDPYEKAFKNISHHSLAFSGLTNTHVLAVWQDNKHGLWLGTKGGGLLYAKDGQHFLKKNLDNAGSSVRAFSKIDQSLWVSTSQGLAVCNNDKKNSDIKVFRYDKNDNASISGDKITAVAKDKSGIIWVGTQDRGLNKLIAYKNGKPVFKNYGDSLATNGYLQNDRVSCLLVDHKNNLWVGTYNGLHLYNRKSDSFTLINQRYGLSNNTILAIVEDGIGNLWIGTQQGLNKLSFNSKNQIIINNYSAQAGFPSDYVHAVLTDKSNNVWMSTNKGITQYNTKAGSFRNFDMYDGLVTDYFSENAAFLSNSGEMFFGCIKGVVSFYPDSIKLNTRKPSVYLTRLMINNKKIRVKNPEEKNRILNFSLFATRKINLSYKENTISLGFSALDYHAPTKNQYAYKLEGFDKNWVYCGNRKTATYTNLPPGKYNFCVMGSNSDQKWNTKGPQLQIEISSPPWATWWAYSLYIVAIISGFYLLIWFILVRINLKNKLQIANLNYEKEHAIAEVKSKVFTNISHEFRTPLTLMIGPLEDMVRENISPEMKNSIYKIQNQAKRVLSLVNQLLDLQKSEMNLLKLHSSNYDIVQLVKVIYESFQDEAMRKKISYAFYTNTGQIFLMLDKDKFENIVYNLLSNAFKFTPIGGSIHVSVNFLNGLTPTCELIIIDTGKGIKKSEQQLVFDRFYQASQTEPGKYMGTGIGLAFVKELVELHKGTITLESDEGKGSSFKITLPLEPSNAIPLVSDKDNKNIDETENTNITKLKQKKDLPLVLVVEDNEELNIYLCKLLGKTSDIISAANGREGIAMAFEEMPDLIVSDVMMPEIDGLHLCETLKTDKRTSHIPIILLTAKSDDHTHISGIKYGADNYLSKPFNPQVLLSYVEGLLDSRKKLKELFSSRFGIEPKEINLATENDFIKNAIQFVEDNIEKDDFSIEDFAKELNMSKSTFYRKIKALTGMSGLEFKRLIRLRRSVQLLNSGQFTVSEAAFKSGFNDLKYFRTSFHKQYGINPSDYLKKNKTTENKIDDF